MPSVEKTGDISLPHQQVKLPLRDCLVLKVQDCRVRGYRVRDFMMDLTTAGERAASRQAGRICCRRVGSLVLVGIPENGDFACIF